MADNVPIPQLPPQQPINGQSSGLKIAKKRSINRVEVWVAAVIAAFLLAVAGCFLWYHLSLRPVSNHNEQLVKITIAPGSTPGSIGELLQKQHIIRSSLAFDIYTRLSGVRDKLQAGTYRLSPAETIPQIVNHFVEGTVDHFTITFFPGATLKQNRQVLLDAGFTAEEVDTALQKTYDDPSYAPLFADKPIGTDLEGYIYGETYNFNSGATVEDILARTFTQFYTVIKDNDIVSGLAKQGLNLYQGITLASIIQREVTTPNGSSGPTHDQQQVAQVFYKRLAMNMPLGSDVTFMYAAAKLGVPASPTLDSPYNTRLHAGLPPGPIATPSVTALEATVSPASGDYLFFLSGDDGKTYFATTDAQHEANIANYCKVKCQ